jgi:ankyrin repeat protein
MFSEAGYERLFQVIHTESDGSPSLVGLVSEHAPASINSIRDEHGYSLACLMVSRKQAANIKLLHSIRCNMSEPTNTGWTPVMIAVRGNDLPLLELLHQLGSDFSLTDSVGWTALHHAVACGHQSLLTWLLPLTKSCINARDLQGETALHWAARLNDFPTVEALVKAGADTTIPDKNGFVPMQSCCLDSKFSHWLTSAYQLNNSAVSDPSSLSSFAKLGILPNAIQINSLPWEARIREEGILRSLIALGVCPARQLGPVPDICDELASLSSANDVVIAAGKSRNFDESLKALQRGITQGACVDTIDFQTGLSCMHLAVIACNDRLVASLLVHKADVNLAERSSQWTPLHFAAALGREETVGILVKAGASVVTQTRERVTPLVLAIRSGSLASVKLLMSGASHGDIQSGLETAVSHGNAEMVSACLSSGAVCSFETFSVACKAGHLLSVIAMLTHTPKLAPCVEPVTALNGLMMIASVPLGIVAEYANDQIDRLLALFRDKRVDLNGVDGNGKTAMMHAATAGRVEMCDALIRAGIGGRQEAAETARRAGFFDLYIRLLGVEKPIASTPYCGSSFGFNRHQNISFLAQQASCPLAVRLENLPAITTTDRLADWMTNHGARPSRLRLAADAISGKLDGVAYATFRDRAALQMTVKLNGQTFQDRKIRVFIDEALLAGTAGGESPVFPDWLDTDPVPVKKPKDVSGKKVTRFDPTV